MSALAPSRQRSTTVFGIALSELFILLLFLVILLWIATMPAKSETGDLRLAALEARIKQLEDEVRELRIENAQLKTDIDERDRLLKLLWQLYEKKPITLTPGTAEWRDWLNNWYANAQKREEMGGRGHPNCLGKGNGALFRLTIADQGVSVQSASEIATKAITNIPAAHELISLGTVSVQRFDELGTQIRKWSDQQTPACRFDVVFVDKTTLLKAPYAAAIRAIDNNFYKKEVRG
jgi:hypothetical protein